jgi:agmatinase
MQFSAPQEAPFNFMGVDKERSSSAAPIVILPVPLEATVSFGKGTAKGPRAIIDASRYLEWYDRETNKELVLKGIHTAEMFEPEFTSLSEYMKQLEEHAYSFIKHDKFLCAFGGEHSITYPLVRAYKRKFSNISVLHFDAHADLRNEYKGSPYSHASVLRRIHDIAHTVHVGIRSVCAEEIEFINEQDLAVYFAEEMHKDASLFDKALAKLHECVYVTFDLDVLDPAIMPATGTPEPGGFGWYETLSYLRKVAENRTIIGCDIVELAPSEGDHSSPFIAAKLAYKLLNFIHQ